jgi:cytochrome c553
MPIRSFILLSLLLAKASANGNPQPGAMIYKNQCASCHGANGEGVPDKFDEPLTGDRSLEALTKKIERTMPEEDPDACVGEDAKQVAAYIYDAFYSPTAQARLNPIEMDLTRLTISQYRTSVADLIGQFRNGSDKDWGKERGLHFFYRSPEILKPEDRAKLKSNADPRKKTVKIDGRIDLIDLQLGADSPAKDQIDPDEFELRFEGSLIAPETGTYEFIVRSQNGFRLSINDREKPIIDAWVSSGDTVREERASLYLIGGRAYYLALDHFKFREKAASLQLLWKPPHGVEELIPNRHLSPERMPPVMVVSTPFPADDRSLGYERGSSISKEWDQAATQAAIAVAEYVDSHLDELAAIKPDTTDRPGKLQTFAETFTQFAFRRPLSDPQKQFIAAQFKTAPSPELAVKRSVLFTLKSPHFLYPGLLETQFRDDYTVAARLALAIWDSIPDKRLLQAAKEKRLHEKADVLRAAQRLVTDPRSRAKVDGFFHHWLELDQAEDASKDPKAFPGFDQSALADLRTSLRLFIEDTVWSDTSDYRQLLQADYLYLNPRLAKLYGKEVTTPDFQRVSFDPKQRAGVVTHPYLLSSFAYTRTTSPIHRGVFLTRNIVGLSLKSPPMAVAFEESHFKPGLTMREKVTELTRAGNCMSCHSLINPLGFSLENFDAIGRWRTKDENKPVNATSDFPITEDKTIRLTGPRDIVNHVVNATDGQRAFIRQLFHHTVKQPTAAFGPNTLDNLQKSFVKDRFNIQKVLTEIATIAALHQIPSK